MSCDSQGAGNRGAWFKSYLKGKARRYGIPEAVAFGGAFLLAFISWKTGAESVGWITSFADVGEYVLFYGTIMIQTMVRSGQPDIIKSLCQAAKMVAETAKAEGVDVFTRPAIIAVAVSFCQGQEWFGIIIGKVAADIVFYLSLDASDYLCEKGKNACSFSFKLAN